MVIAGVVIVLILFLVGKKLLVGPRKKGYWKYPDSSRVYYSDKDGVTGFKGGNEEYSLHRQLNGLPNDFTKVDTVEVFYEEPNKYYLTSDNIVLI